MIVLTKIVSLFGASAITVFPFVFIDSRIQRGTYTWNMLVKHEKTHLEQQRQWAVYGLGVGLLVWFFLYLFCLPIWYNPWRRKWETEAYKATGYSTDTIKCILRVKPYYLK